MLLSERLQGLVTRIYDAAADPTLWPLFLEDFATEVWGGPTGLVHYDDERSPSAPLSYVVRSTLDYQGRYIAHYSKINPWMDWVKHQTLSRALSISTSEERFPFSDLKKTEIYNDYLRPQEAVHQFGCILEKTDTRMMQFTCLRSAARGPFGPPEIQLLHALLPHLRRAVQFNRRFAQAESQARASVDVMEQLPTGIMLLDSCSRLIFANRVAQSILDQNDGLAATKHGLAAATVDRTMKLRSIIADAVRTTRGEGFSSGGAMGLQRPSGKRSFLLIVSPIITDTFQVDRLRAAIVVFVSDPENSPRSRNGLLSEVYDLTEAESRLAVRLAQGDTLVYAAEVLGITHNTARTHLKRIFDKTDTHHQGGLVRILLGALAQVDSEDIR